LVKFKFHQICLNSFKCVRSNSLFIRPVYRRIRSIYLQNRPKRPNSSVEDITVHILNQINFDRFLLDFTEFGQFFSKTEKMRGGQFFSLHRFFLNPAQPLLQCCRRDLRSLVLRCKGKNILLCSIFIHLILWYPNII
jgi:hypothetical protein